MQKTHHEFIDEVAFEVPTYFSANGLLVRLRPTWNARLQDLGYAWAVVAELRSEPNDVAVLLRDVESWLDASGLGAIRFCLDERDYVLEGVNTVWEALVS